MSDVLATETLRRLRRLAEAAQPIWNAQPRPPERSRLASSVTPEVVLALIDEVEWFRQIEREAKATGLDFLTVEKVNLADLVLQERKRAERAEAELANARLSDFERNRVATLGALSAQIERQ